MCFALRFLESFAYFTLNSVFTLHLTEVLELGDMEAGTIFGIRGALTTIYAALLGPLVDRLGVAWSARAAFASAALGRLLFATATDARAALLAVCGPMALGHGLLAPVLTIGVKRAASAGSAADSQAFSWLYWATVLGILCCGPLIDVTTAQFPLGPYRVLGMLTSAFSCAGLIISWCFLEDAGSHEKEAVSFHVVASLFTAASVRQWHSELRQIVCTRRFARFCAYSIAILPGCSVIRNLDGGIFPQFMVRTFGPLVLKGTIYAMNPMIDLLLVPMVAKRTADCSHFGMIRTGLTVAAFAPLVVTLLGPSLASVLAFVSVLTVGDIFYNPRLDAYAMAIAPQGREGTFAGVSSGVVFIADVPTGLLGGFLLRQFCPRTASGCDAQKLFGSLAAFASLTPLLLWTFPMLFREPLLDQPPGDAKLGPSDIERQPEPAEEQQELVALCGGTLCAGMRVAVTDTFQTDDDERDEIMKGVRGTVLQIDEDGDAEISFDGRDTDHWVFEANFHVLCPVEGGGRSFAKSQVAPAALVVGRESI